MMSFMTVLRYRKIFMLVFYLLSVLLVLAYLNLYTSYKTAVEKVSSLTDSIGYLGKTLNKTVILWYNGVDRYNVTNHLHSVNECHIPNCYMTTNKNFMALSSVVIFVADHIYEKTPPSRGQPGQIWVFEGIEAPTNVWINNVYFQNEAWRDKFNYTMHFRRDSDFYHPYGIIVRKSKSEVKNWLEIMKRKENKVAWLVSNCDTQSQREEYVKMLRKFVDVDIYGKCGNKVLPRDKTHEFIHILETKYKFYLSFENIFCDDYISEKLFQYYNVNIILIVRGGGDYSSVVPNETYINTKSYPSVKRLGEHLQYLMNNNTAYVEMLKTKNQFVSIMDSYEVVIKKQPYVFHLYERKALCDICGAAASSPKQSHKIINRLDTWFNLNKCHQPTDLHEE